jgi:sec-independent protein translocase protein TatC
MFYVDKIIEIFSQQTGGFVFLHPTEALFARLKIAFVVALFLSIPVIIFEVWRFVGIGLTPGERRKTLVFLPISYLLFCGGVAVAWFGVLPFAIQFLLGFETETLQPFLSIDRYIGFVAWFSMAFGVMFQLPIVIFLLVKIGVVTPKQLARYRPHVILGLAILAALLTPGPDFFSQLALLIPTYLLFEISLLAARLTSK